MPGRWLLIPMLLLLPTAAWAEPSSADKARAKELYERGLRSHDENDFQTAATSFAEADKLAPSAVALTAALDSATLADDVLLGAELLERAARRPPAPNLTKAQHVAEEKLGRRASKIEIQCPVAMCFPSIDGRTVSSPAWIMPGRHKVVVRFGPDTHEQAVNPKAGETILIVPVAGTKAADPPPTPSSPEGPVTIEVPKTPVKAPGGLSKGLFIGALGATAGLGLLTVGLGLITERLGENFQENGCDRAPYPNCDRDSSTGEGFRTATNVGIVVTSVSAAATILIAIFTNWKGAPPKPKTAAIEW